MTKKHFIKFAAEINEHRISYSRHEAQTMADMVCKIAISDNPNFDKARFLKACGL